MSSPFLHLFISSLCLSILFLQPLRTCLAADEAVFLPLVKTFKAPLKIMRPFSNKLPFRHNVTLTVTLTVGTPPQPTTMVLDTGSELSYLNCKKTPTTPSFFNSAKSKSYIRIPCSSPVCKTQTQDFPIPVTCEKNICIAALSYADGTTIEGSLAYETFRFGKSSFGKTVFGCMDSGQSTNPEEDAKTTGLLGLNLGLLSFVTQTKFNKFSYCIASLDSSGVLLFGDVKADWLKSLRYTPLVRRDAADMRLPYFNRIAYTVKLVGIKVGKKQLNLPKTAFEPDHTGAGQTMIDSGTRFSYLLGPVYTALRAEYVAQTKNILKVYEDSGFVFEGAMDLCYRVPLGKPKPALPSVTLMFEGAEMVLTAERLLYKVVGMVRGNDGIECLTFGNSELLGVEAFIIGHHHQQNKWMEFDLQKWRVGFSDIQCNEASQRLSKTG